MKTILVAKQIILNLYSKYEVYITPLIKFLLAFVALLLINFRLGYMESIDKMAIVLIVALMCSFMPINLIVVMSAFFVILHLYAFSLECAATIGAAFLIMFLLYFRFSPKDTLVVLLTPIGFMLKIPYVMPIVMGLLGTPVSGVSVGCGVVAYYMIHYVRQNVTVITAMADEEMTARFRFIIDGLLRNKEMIITVAAFVTVISIVYIIRRLRIDYCWTIAIVAGAVTNIMIMLIGDLIFETNVSLIGVLLGTAVAVVVAVIVQFFAFNLDYKRTENVQFEDDDYYYYVKAVPKVNLARAEKKVKRINSQYTAKNAMTRTTRTK